MAYIYFRGGNRNYIRPDIFDTFILHKPDYSVVEKIDVLPWESLFDKYDGMKLRITGESKDFGNPIHGVCWSCIFENGDKLTLECLDVNWLEKVNDYEELDEMQIDFFDI
jgi:hypothetical protein